MGASTRTRTRLTWTRSPRPSPRSTRSSSRAASGSIAACNYADSLLTLHRFEEAKSVLSKMIPVARRVHGDSFDVTLKLRWSYGAALYMDAGAPLDDLSEAVTTL